MLEYFVIVPIKCMKIWVLTQKNGVSLVNKTVFCMVLWLMMSANAAFAHPGNTDSSGGHTCQTNCEKWNLNYGEYHYHDSTSDYGEYHHPESTPVSSESDYEDGYDLGYELNYDYASKCGEGYQRWQTAEDYNRYLAESQAFLDGHEQGVKTGYLEGYSVCFEDSHQAGYNYGYLASSNDYEYNVETDELLHNVSSYEKGYEKGWAQAKSENESEEEIEEVEVFYESDSSNESKDLLATILIGTLIFSGLVWFIIKIVRITK